MTLMTMRSLGCRGLQLFPLLAVTLLLLIPAGAFGQLSDREIADLQQQAAENGWTFTVGRNPATEIPLEDLCGLVVPEGWEKDADFDPCTPTRDLPAVFDWRDLGGVTPVKSQGSCGSCWAFATVGPLECNIKIHDSVTVNLSEQWLVNCNSDGYGCDGGWWAHDYHEWKNDPCGDDGAVLEANCPYTAEDDPCYCPYPHDYWILDWHYVGGSGSIPPVDNIKQAIMDYGPVSVAVYADAAMQAYNGGIYNSCTNGTVNHAVVLVGWDDDQAGGVWFMRNSWGTWWGEDGGYMRIPYGCSRIGYAACYVEYSADQGLSVSPLTDFESGGPVGGPFTPSSKVYTLENMGDYGINYSVSKNASWLTISSSSGYLPAYGSTTVSVSINSNANSLSAATYADMVNFVNTTNHIGDTTRNVSLSVGSAQMIYEWRFDTDPGWMTDDDWAFGQPTGGGGEHGGPDPTSGYSGSNVYGYNLYGDYPNNLPERHLTTSTIDCTGLADVTLKFRRWLGVEQPDYDHAYVRASNNGMTWVTVWDNSSEITDSSWVQQEYDLSSIADDESTLYLRWTMGATDGGWRYCGWNIDDVQIWALNAAPPLGACCPGDGSCLVSIAADCTGAWMGSGSTCSPNPCPQPSGACCIAEACTVTTEAGCTGDWLGAGTSCNPNPCLGVTGACCYPDGSCNVTSEADCTGAWEGEWTNCDPNPCPQPTGACCELDGTCNITPESGCNGVWMGAGTTCTPNPCSGVIGACCQADGTCSVEAIGDCTGTWMGEGSDCTPNPCPQPSGACCLADDSCIIATQAGCTGTWLGMGTDCNPNPCLPSVCPGDSNCDDGVTWQDIDYFVAAMNDDMAAWEAMFAPGSPSCSFANNDVNEDGTCNWQDIDPLVTLMNTTCP
ncbi:MAG: hypothetical protein KAY37_05130 [Phycisphaerae bacterium]|nr:hypothetical protein [Phycisphaerae bacterium]